MERWPEIAQQICDDIRAGRWPVGGAISTTQRLVDDTGAAQRTVRKAVDHLVETGILRGEVGRGVFVVRVPDERMPEPMTELERVKHRVDALEERMRRLEQGDEPPTP